jgi:hypothetical protein
LREDILRHSPEITTVLQRTCGIEGGIVLNIDVTKEKASALPIKTEDKVKFLTKENPELLNLIKELDLVGYMYAIGKERCITFDPQEYYYAKNTCNLAPVIKLPVVVDEKGVGKGNNAMSSIVASYKTAQEKRQETTAEYEQLLDVITENVEGATDVDSLNEAMVKVFGMTHIYDSLLRAKKAVAAKGTALGLTYNQTTKKYEAKL